MKGVTTIQLSKPLVNSLKEIKEYPRQSYNELILHMITVFMNIKTRNQYDEFLHKVQKNKMNELWDNKEDEVWEGV